VREKEKKEKNKFTLTLICFVVSISLKVTDKSLDVSGSTVIAKGIPNSSVLAYLLPMLTPVSSTLLEIPLLINSCSIEKLSNKKKN
jgi:hypothetical protein